MSISKQETAYRITYQNKLKEFCQIFKTNKAELYPKLGIKTTSGFHYLELEKLTQKLQKIINLAFKIGFLKICLIQTFIQIKIAKFQFSNTFLFKRKFKKVKIYNQKGQLSQTFYSMRF